MAILRIVEVRFWRKGCFCAQQRPKVGVLRSRILINATFVAKTPTVGAGSLQLHLVDEEDKLLLVVHVQLAVDVADVGLRRALGDVELLLDGG